MPLSWVCQPPGESGGLPRITAYLQSAEISSLGDRGCFEGHCGLLRSLSSLGSSPKSPQVSQPEYGNADSPPLPVATPCFLHARSEGSGDLPYMSSLNELWHSIKSTGSYYHSHNSSCNNPVAFLLGFFMSQDTIWTTLYYEKFTAELSAVSLVINYIAFLEWENFIMCVYSRGSLAALDPFS